MQFMTFRPMLHAKRKQNKDIFQKFVITHIFLEGNLPADRFRILRTIRRDFPLINAKSKPGNPSPLFSQKPDNPLLLFLYITNCSNSRSVQLRSRHLTHSVKHTHVTVNDQIYKIPGRWDLKIPVRLFLLACHFRRRL